MMNIRKTVRRFSTAQRVALFIRSRGTCVLCGTKLGPGWHADHRQPYSKGGATDTLNGQSLCPTCNRKKGAKENHD